MKKKETQPSEEGLIKSIKSKIFNLYTLTSLVIYPFVMDANNRGRMIQTNLAKFFVDYGISMFDFGTRITGIYEFTNMFKTQVAVKDGVVFVMNIKEFDGIAPELLNIQVPIWQKTKAKKILQEYLLEQRPQGVLNGCRSIPRSLVNQTQYVRQEVYDYVANIFERMVNDKDWYNESGKRYKESILLHGEPGTGKTNLYMHFASKYNLNVYTHSPQGFVQEFNEILELAQSDDRLPLLVLIEDIHAIQEFLLPEYKSTNINVHGDLNGEEFSYSKFINCLDGAEALHNIIVCLSTNHIDQMIPSITRRGRVDHKIELKPLSSKELSEFVATEHQEFIGGFEDSTWCIANIPDLKRCDTEDEIGVLASWLDDEKQH